MRNAIIIGARVICPSHENKTGTVTGILRDIGNGQPFAVINVDHDLPGIFESMPVAELQAMKKQESSHVV